MCGRQVFRFGRGRRLMEGTAKQKGEHDHACRHICLVARGDIGRGVAGGLCFHHLGSAEHHLGSAEHHLGSAEEAGGCVVQGWSARRSVDVATAPGSRWLTAPRSDTSHSHHTYYIYRSLHRNIALMDHRDRRISSAVSSSKGYTWGFIGCMHGLVCGRVARWLPTLPWPTRRMAHTEPHRYVNSIVLASVTCPVLRLWHNYLPKSEWGTRT